MLASLNWNTTTVDLQNVRSYIAAQSGDENVERWKLMFLRDLNHPTPDVAKLVMVGINAMFRPEIVWRRRYDIPQVWNEGTPPLDEPIVLGVR